MFNKSLHRFSLFTSVSTFFLIFVGGLVTSTGSGLSVPDWPTTYGQNMFTFPVDQWIGGIKYEHGHRLFASMVGLFTVVLTAWVAWKEERKWVKWVSYYALGAVILQGILGGLTVLFLLPTAISVSHGMLAQTFFCAISSIALFTSKWWIDGRDKIQTGEHFNLQTLTIAAAAVIFLQLAFGALLRHTYSGLAVPDYPLAYGQIFPSLSKESMEMYQQVLIGDGIKWPGDKPIAAYQIVIHLIHRYWAFVAAGMLIVLGTTLIRNRSLPKRLNNVGLFLLLLVIIQFSLGIITVISKKEYIITSLHVVTGALILVTCVLTSIAVARMRWLSTNPR